MVFLLSVKDVASQKNPSAKGIIGVQVSVVVHEYILEASVRKYRYPCLVIPQQKKCWAGQVKQILGVKISPWRKMVSFGERPRGKDFLPHDLFGKATDYLMDYDLCSSSVWFSNISNSPSFHGFHWLPLYFLFRMALYEDWHLLVMALGYRISFISLMSWNTKYLSF